MMEFHIGVPEAAFVHCHGTFNLHKHVPHRTSNSRLIRKTYTPALRLRRKREKLIVPTGDLNPQHSTPGAPADFNFGHSISLSQWSACLLHFFSGERKWRRQKVRLTGQYCSVTVYTAENSLLSGWQKLSHDLTGLKSSMTWNHTDLMGLKSVMTRCSFNHSWPEISHDLMELKSLLA